MTLGTQTPPGIDPIRIEPAGVIPNVPLAPGRSRGARAMREMGTGLLFLAPNILGFLAFTLIPLVFSLVLAFSNWDLRLHNMFKPENRIRFIGLQNFIELLHNADFWKYLGNTLFLMMGMPIGIALSLMAALLLSKDLRGGSKLTWAGLVATAVFGGSVIVLSAFKGGDRGILLVLLVVAAVILVAGAIGGSTVYRTLFYIPNFTSGVATMLLWKKLFQPSGGVINNLLDEPLVRLTTIIRHLPSWEVRTLLWILLALAAWIFRVGARRLRKLWSDGDIGSGSLAMGAMFLFLPEVLAQMWLPAMPWSTSALMGMSLLFAGWEWARADRGTTQRPPRLLEGVGSAIMLGVSLMVVLFVLIGLALVCWDLPDFAAAPDGLSAPAWLQSPQWVKPALMLMGLWGAIGSGTMLLYLAALTNVPQDLYEAADIDGAGRFAKFWNVTWPQLAPTTFFIVVMGMIGGLQGGFDQAKVMTNGGPAGASTTLAFMIYQEGFESGRLGYSSGAAWTLFLLVLIITAFNWRFGNKYVND